VPELDPHSLNCLLRAHDSEWSGLALHIRDKPFIIINNSHSLARQESTIMHELSHIVCKHPMGEFKSLSEGVFLRDFNKEHEDEAEWLGGCLQLPGVALYYSHEDGLSIQEISEKFNASVDMVRFRMNMCGIGKRRGR
jgi:Zn-dependent peptidase ImmA (M78 family)